LKHNSTVLFLQIVCLKRQGALAHNAENSAILGSLNLAWFRQIL